MQKFKNQYKEFSQLALELEYLRSHNRLVEKGETKILYPHLLFAEGTLCMVTLERFLRMVLGKEAREGQTLLVLLDMATSKKRNLLDAGKVYKTADGVFASSSKVKRFLRKVRNSILHGNFEQAAKETGCKSVEQYLRTEFAGEVEAFYKITNAFVAQIDKSTGKPLGKRA